MLADIAGSFDWQTFLQFCLNGLLLGMLYALIALGYTMVYGIVELINFAHGDLFMLGTFYALTVLTVLGFNEPLDSPPPGTLMAILAFIVLIITVPMFTAGTNVAIDRIVYKPLRNAPKLAPLVSAIGVSFVLMNIGFFWSSFVDEAGRPVSPSSDRSFPGNVLPSGNLLGEESALQFTPSALMVILVTIPIMLALTWMVKFTTLGKSMRAVAQNPTAARLMGINVDRVIMYTFLIGGALAGVGSIVYGLHIKTISYQVGFQNGLYAFTAAVLGGIGNIPGAVLGALIIGLVRTLGSSLIDESWVSAMVFVILIVILVFRPAGLLGARIREKV